MRVLRYSFEEAVRSLWRGRRSNSLSVATIAAALLVLRVGFAVGESWYGETAAQVLGVDAVRFLPPDMGLLLVAGGMVVGCVGGLVAARSTRSGAEISGEP